MKHCRSLRKCLWMRRGTIVPAQFSAGSDQASEIGTEFVGSLLPFVSIVRARAGEGISSWGSIRVLGTVHGSLDHRRDGAPPPPQHCPTHARFRADAERRPGGGGSGRGSGGGG